MKNVPGGGRPLPGMAGSWRWCLASTLVFTSLMAYAGPDTVHIQEWLVPWEKTRPRDPYVDGQGRVWFCGQAGNYIAYFDPATEEFKKYELGEGSAPHNLIVDQQGYVWFEIGRAHV